MMNKFVKIALILFGLLILLWFILFGVILAPYSENKTKMQGVTFDFDKISNDYKYITATDDPFSRKPYEVSDSLEGKKIVLSVGPDKLRSLPVSWKMAELSLYQYDPTNGMISNGDLFLVLEKAE